MSADQTQTRTLKDVSFETFSVAKIALERHADRAGDDDEADRAEDALAELVSAWNDANARDGDE